MKIINIKFPFKGWFTNGSITIENGKITEISDNSSNQNFSDETIDGNDNILLPGFIDMHIHGWGGCDVMDNSVDAILKIAEELVKFGVTSFLPTTYTNSPEITHQTIATIKKSQNIQTLGAQILGVHLEGPYINKEVKGAQPEGYIRTANPDEYNQWFIDKIVRQVTIAPEIPENEEFIRECVKRGIVVSLGHCKATYDDVIKAVKLGATQTTHTFNGMTGIHHRDPGVVGAALTENNLSCEIIADLFHLHPAIIKLVILAKGIDKVILITDAISAAGLPSGEYKALNDKVQILPDGKVINPNGSLAGSSLSLDRALINTLNATDMTLEKIWPLTSRNAAKQLGLNKGELMIGYDADFVLLDENNQVKMTIIAGKIAYQK